VGFFFDKEDSLGFDMPLWQYVELLYNGKLAIKFK
jgi:hypothetical protein